LSAVLHAPSAYHLYINTNFEKNEKQSRLFFKNTQKRVFVENHTTINFTRLSVSDRSGHVVWVP